MMGLPAEEIRETKMKKALIPLLLIVLLTVSATLTFAEKAPLRNGDEGDTVARLQLRLFELGFFTFKPTGLFGTVTQSALRAFQQNAGLTVTGTANGETLAALFAHAAAPAPFAAQIPLTFSGGSGSNRVKGEAGEWSEVKDGLKKGEAYEVTHCESGATCRLVMQGVGGHAHMRPETEKDAQALNAWLGATNSYYKCAVTVQLNGRPVAASLQWSGERCCLYFSGSLSDVFGLPDVEHEAIIQAQTH